MTSVTPSGVTFGQPEGCTNLLTTVAPVAAQTDVSLPHELPFDTTAFGIQHGAQGGDVQVQLVHEHTATVSFNQKLYGALPEQLLLYILNSASVQTCQPAIELQNV